MNTKHNLIVGILAGLAITLKQTSGICISIVCLGYPLLLVHSREELKTYLTLFLARLAGVVIPVGSMMIYLAMNNAIADFISYTMQGVSGFSNYISYTRLLQPNIIGLLSILVPITMLVEWARVVILDKDRKQLERLSNQAILNSDRFSSKYFAESVLDVYKHAIENKKKKLGLIDKIVNKVKSNQEEIDNK